MIVCRKYRFIFLKTRKTAGTSVEIALASLCDADDILTPIEPADEAIRIERTGSGARNWQGRFNPWPELFGRFAEVAPKPLRDWRRRRRFFNHMSAFQIRARLDPGIWDSYFKFCFERNPWDKTVSAYYFARRGKETGPEDFARFTRSRDLPVDFPRYTLGGRIAVDFIGRYESLAADLAQVCAQLGAPVLPELPHAKAGLRPERHYRELYTAETRERIARAFRREIAQFAYEF